MDVDLVETDDGTTLMAVPEERGRYRSNVRAFAEYFLGEPLEAYIARRRAEDPPRPWADIAVDMAAEINATAARLDPDRPALSIKISGNLPWRLYGEERGDPEA